MELHERIRIWRRAAGIASIELARRLDVSPSAVTQWENGTTRPTVRNLEAIARECGISMQLFWGELPSAGKGDATE